MISDRGLAAVSSKATLGDIDLAAVANALGDMRQDWPNVHQRAQVRQPSASPLQAEWFDAGPALDRLREDWIRLQSLDSKATLYQTWEWNSAWWRVLRRRKRSQILVLRNAGRVVAIAPFYVSRHFRLPLRRLAFFGTGVSDYLDMVAEDAFRTDASRSVLDALSAARTYDLADLQQIQPGSPLLAAASARSSLEILAQEPCPRLPLAASWEEQLGRFGKKLRQNIGYHERLIDRTWPDSSFELCDGSSLDDGLTSLFELHKSRWRSRLLPGVLGSRAIQSFHREVARAFAEKGLLRLHLLRVGGRVVAALYCFRYGTRTYYYLGGFDPSLSKYSLGTVLTGRAIRHAIEEGCQIFDFLRGAEPYKYRWTSEEDRNSQLLSPTGGLRGRALRGIARLERSVEDRAKEFAEHRGRGRG